jgi:hypothetical protein
LVCNWIILLHGGPIPRIDLLLYKMSTVCFVIRRLFHVLNIDVLGIRYFAYFHLLIKYGVILGGNSTNVGRIFLLHKRIRILIRIGHRCSCKDLFKKYDTCILPVPCVYILSVMIFVVNNLENFQANCHYAV